MQAQGPRLFRSQALQQLNAPAQLDQLLQMASPRNWLLVVGAVATLLAFGFWTVGGRPAPQVSGNGILVHPPGLYSAEADTSGTIMSINVRPGDIVHAGQTIALLQPATGAPRPVVSREDATVVSLPVSLYQVVTPGTAVASLEPLSDDLEAVVYVPVSQGKGIRPGMAVRLSPSVAKKEEYGVMLGTVTSVSPYSVSETGINMLTGNEVLTHALTSGRAVHKVRVQVLRDPNSRSGIKWSSGRGPNLAITSGTLCSADIVLGGGGLSDDVKLPPVE